MSNDRVKLIDLEPRWIHPNLFVFLCPHCRKVFLTCKNIAMRESEQFDLYEKEFGADWNLIVVPCDAEFAWSISGSVPTEPNAAFITNLTVKPSVDASSSGHWHGFITDGEIS